MTDAPPPGAPLATRLPEPLALIDVVQVLLVEAAVIALLVALGSPAVLSVFVASVVPVTTALLGRRRGRSWQRYAVLRWRLRSRRATAATTDDGDARLALVRGLAPALAVSDVAAADGSPAGVGYDETGWFAAASLRADGPLGLPVGHLVQALGEAGQPGVVLQLVSLSTPVPSSRPPADAARTSRAWVAIRLDARRLAEAGADDAEGAAVVVVALLRRLARTLRRLGVATDVLDRDGLLTALALSCGLDDPTADAAAQRPHETWRSWHSGSLAHRSFWLRDWPCADRAAALISTPAEVPASATTVAFVLLPDDDQIRVRCLVRVAAPADGLDLACAEVGARAAAANARLMQLDGEHAAAAYATAPTGGGPC